jgi:preprotein translocase subunit Sec61beta
MKALKLFPKLVIAVGIAVALAGVVAASAGIYIRTFVGQQLTA